MVAPLNNAVITPTATYETSGLSRAIYPYLKSFSELGDRVDAFVSQKAFHGTPSTLTLGERSYNWALEAGGSFLKKIMDYDYREFHKLGRFKISEPPIGALILLLFPFTVLPRFRRAYKRDKTHREQWDVVRRDIPAITIFLFALKPLNNCLNELWGKLRGVKLVNTNLKDIVLNVFGYSQMDEDYAIKSPKTFQAIVEHGYGKALLRATKKLNDGGITKLTKDTTLQKQLEKLTQLVTEMVEGDPKNRESLSAEAFRLVQQMDQHKEPLLEHSSKVTEPVIYQATKALSKFEGYFARYAKNSRLLIDVISFAAVCYGIGKLPLQINAWWNEREYQETMAKLKMQGQSGQNSGDVWAAMKKQSQLKPSFTSAELAYTMFK